MLSSNFLSNFLMPYLFAACSMVMLQHQCNHRQTTPLHRRRPTCSVQSCPRQQFLRRLCQLTRQHRWHPHQVSCLLSCLQWLISKDRKAHMTHGETGSQATFDLFGKFREPTLSTSSSLMAPSRITKTGRTVCVIMPVRVAHVARSSRPCSLCAPRADNVQVGEHASVWRQRLPFVL